jgi:hypothetical protein
MRFCQIFAKFLFVSDRKRALGDFRENFDLCQDFRFNFPKNLNFCENEIPPKSTKFRISKKCKIIHFRYNPKSRDFYILASVLFHSKFGI